MPCLWKTWTLVWLIACSTPAAAEQLVLPPELYLGCGRAEQRLLDDLADGRLDRHSILEAALIAGGAAEPDVNDCRTRIDQQVAVWRTSGGIEGTALQRARRLFEFMHGELLTGGYHADANDLAQTIQQGTYNCLSGTLLWQHLAAEFEILSVAHQLPGHVQSVLVVDQTRIVVELTSPRWFDLLDAGRQQPEIEGRDLDQAALVASVYYNRGLTLLGQREFASALTATYHAHRLDPESAAARSNVLAILNNWALALAEQRQLRRAIVLLEQGQALAPEHESFGENLSVLRPRDSHKPPSH